MRVLWLLLLAHMVSADPDLWQLLRLWRPTPPQAWHHVTSECARAMDTFSHALDQRQQWASSMLDASGQASSQFLQGSTFWLGSFPQCEEVNQQFPAVQNVTSQIPTAVYRVLKLNVNLSEPLKMTSLANQVHSEFFAGFRPIWLGVCVPGACGAEEDIGSLLKQMLESAELEQKFRHVQLVSVKKLPSEDSIWNYTSTWLLVALSSTMFGMAVIGTIYDSLHSQDKKCKTSPLRTTLLAFSVSRNARSLFSLSGGTEGTLPALNGIRVIGMTWIILCHLSIITFIFAENPAFRQRVEKDVLYQSVSNGTYSVDTFFFLSGVLLSYALLRYQSGKKHDSVWEACRKFFLLVQYRVLRLSLPYIFSILITIVAFRNMSANSPFETSAPDHIVCEKYWWRNLLYVNNLFALTDMCLGWSWYLSADTQLYVLALILLLLYVNGYERAAMAGGVVCLVASWLTSAGITYALNYIPSVQNPFEHNDILYTKPWVRLGPVWVGVATGWLLCKGNFKLTTISATVGWISCVFGMLGTVYALTWQQWFTLFSSALYVSLSHTVWALSLAWILLACVHKRAGWVGSILESPMFAPFGKTTYCAYLLHHLILEWICLNLEGPIPMSRALLFTLWLGLSASSYLLGAVVSLIFESPIMRLLAILRPKNPSSSVSSERDIVTSEADYKGVPTTEMEKEAQKLRFEGKV